MKKKWLALVILNNGFWLISLKLMFFFKVALIESTAWVLPIGFSFSIFQRLSLAIDLYKGKILKDFKFRDYLLYIFFIPTVLAGPIKRFAAFYPQLFYEKKMNIDRLLQALLWIMVGYFYKLVIADNLTPYHMLFFGRPQNSHFAEMTVSITIGIYKFYCDFAGYSFIAVGTAQLFGFNIINNFRRPILARNVADFWSRWHISLTRWFFDYVFRPTFAFSYHWLAKPWPRVFATMLTFLFIGLWHATGFNYLSWGLTHGMIYLCYNGLKKAEGFSRWRAMIPQTILTPLSIAATFGVWFFTAIFIVSEGFADVARHFTNLFRMGSGDMPLDKIASLLLTLFTVGVYEAYHEFTGQEAPFERSGLWHKLFYILVIYILIVFSGSMGGLNFFYETL